ncbi:NAD(P)/FAD-dependent oxidoreductase [Phycicoccus avicenniae]|uniref:NAD(P)/FAD-dependent oxidoreductase n=1 Tax=Phycicoccus avicenniae TaxID=2828860 RepID=UPI003D2D4D53
MARVTVVGGGVVGLTSALRLAESGHDVRCVRDVPAAGTVSAVAGGLWFPYHVEPRERVVAWGLVSLERFTALADDPGSGVALREGVLVERTGPDRWWTEGVRGWRDARPDELPAGAPSGVVARLPLVAMPVHLDWLEKRCAAAGVDVVTGRVGDLDELEDDVLVLATGLRAAELLPGLDVTPSRGQVALLANPGVDRWLVDDDARGGMTYVLPHPGWVVCGGTDVPDASDEPDPAVHAAIVARCREAVPALRDAEVLGSRVGLRPVAAAVDLRVREHHGRPVVTNVGHGGAGVTLSWGCAEEVLRLVDGIPA